VTLPGPVVVTGGGAGIGRATVMACARRGAPVAVLDLGREQAEEAAAQARAAGAPEAVGLQCDVRDEAPVAAAIASAAERLGPLRGLVTSAGIDRGGLVHELPLERWREVLDTNLTGTFLCCKHALAAMLEHGESGSIVCLSSPWAERSAPGGASAYCASKGGVSALVRSLALDYAPHAIRVNAMLPGATETELMWANVPPDERPAMRERTGRQLALGRLAEPEEIGTAIAWMLSDEAAYMTGAQMVVDGGLMARGAIDA
jgi:NAD(P)-dependent dehydrogenase (short-subunit alcohol dehydrogenase family)